MSDPSLTFANTQRNRTIGKESLHEFPRKLLAETEVDASVSLTRKKSVSFGSLDVRNFKSHLPPSAILENQNCPSNKEMHSVLVKKSISSHDSYYSGPDSANNNRNVLDASQRFEVLHPKKPLVGGSGKGLYDILKEKNLPQLPIKATKSIQTHHNKKTTLIESPDSNKSIVDEPIIRIAPAVLSPKNAVYAALAASKAASQTHHTRNDSLTLRNTNVKQKQNHTNVSSTSLLDKKKSLSSLAKNTNRKKKSRTNKSGEGTKVDTHKRSVIKIPDNKKEIMDQIIKENELAKKEEQTASDEFNVQQSSKADTNEKSPIDLRHNGNRVILDIESMQESKLVNDIHAIETNDRNVNSENATPRAKVDYAKLNNNLNDMVNAYIMGIYDDDIGIEYDMPNSIIETNEDIEKYNQQVLLLEKEFASENEKGKANIGETNLDKEKAKQKENFDDDRKQENRPILSDDVVERFETDGEKSLLLEGNGEGSNVEREEEDSDDLGLSSEILNLEISQSYQSLKQLLMGSNFAKLSNQEKEFEELNENGEPIKISRFRAAQLSLSDLALFENLT